MCPWLKSSTIQSVKKGILHALESQIKFRSLHLHDSRKRSPFKQCTMGSVMYDTHPSVSEETTFWAKFLFVSLPFQNVHSGTKALDRAPGLCRRCRLISGLFTLSFASQSSEGLELPWNEWIRKVGRLRQNSSQVNLMGFLCVSVQPLLFQNVWSNSLK